MKIFFLIAYIVVALVTVLAILFQGRGAGLGNAGGGSGETFNTRRGVEKVTFVGTIALVVLFFVLSLLNLFI